MEPSRDNSPAIGPDIEKVSEGDGEKMVASMLGKEGKGQVYVSKKFSDKLQEMGKTKADLLLIDRTKSGLGEELVAAYSKPETVHFSIGKDPDGIRLSAEALRLALCGEGWLPSFQRDVPDRATGSPVTYYYLPVFDGTSGKVALFRLNPNTFSRLKTIAESRSPAGRPSNEGSPVTQEKSRLLLPPRIDSTSNTEIIPGLSRPVPIESATGWINIGGRRVQVEAASTVGGREGEDEDFLFLRQYNIPGIGSFCLASVKDGMGGHSFGEVASQTAALAEDKLLSELTNNPKSSWRAELEDLATRKYKGDFRAALVELAISFQNKAVFEAASSSKPGMGSTTVELFIFENAIYSGHVGDSRAYLDQGQGPYRLTDDHSLTERFVATGQISRQEAPTHPQKNVIYKTLGVNPNVEVDVNIIGYPQSHPFSLILCCDGLSGGVRDVSGGKVNENGKRINPADWYSSQIGNLFSRFSNQPGKLVAEVVGMGVAAKDVDNISYIRLSFP